jgi:hypothetical protein
VYDTAESFVNGAIDASKSMKVNFLDDLAVPLTQLSQNSLVLLILLNQSSAVSVTPLSDDSAVVFDTAQTLLAPPGRLSKLQKIINGLRHN